MDYLEEAYPLSRVKVESLFASNLPPRSFIPWKRRETFAGTEMTALPVGRTKKLKLAKTTIDRAVVLFDVQQFWMDAGLDPMDPDALAAFQDNQNSYGRYVFNLKFSGKSPFDVSESLYDLNSGVPIQRPVRGFSKLNTNILGVQGSAHATAIIVPPSQIIEAEWRKRADPGHVPSVVGVELRGWSIPFEVLKSALGDYS